MIDVTIKVHNVRSFGAMISQANLYLLRNNWYDTGNLRPCFQRLLIHASSNWGYHCIQKNSLATALIIAQFHDWNLTNYRPTLDYSRDLTIAISTTVCRTYSTNWGHDTCGTRSWKKRGDLIVYRHGIAAYPVNDVQHTNNPCSHNDLAPVRLQASPSSSHLTTIHLDDDARPKEWVYSLIDFRQHCSARGLWVDPRWCICKTKTKCPWGSNKTAHVAYLEWVYHYRDLQQQPPHWPETNHCIASEV